MSNENQSSQKFLESLDALLQAGRDNTALGRVYDRYWKRLVGLARQKLAEKPMRAVGADDVAQAGLMNFWKAIANGKHRDVEGRTSLWALLAKIVENRAYDELEKEFAEKRGAGKLRGMSAVLDSDGNPSPLGFDQFGDPSEEQLQWIDQAATLAREALNDDEWQVLIWKLEGLSNKEIGTNLQCATETARLRWQAIVDKVLAYNSHHRS